MDGKNFAITLPLYISFDSPLQNISDFKNFVYRTINNCSPPELLHIELDYLNVAAAIDRSYSPQTIHSVFRKFNKPIHSKNVFSRTDFSSSVII